MRKSLLVALVSGIAAAPLVLQDPSPRQLDERITALEKRVDVLERDALSAKASVAQPVATAQWTTDSVGWLAVACANLAITKASSAALADARSNISEAGREAIERIGAAHSMAWSARLELAKKNTAEGTRLANDALALYNQVAKFVGIEERKIDSPKVEMVKAESKQVAMVLVIDRSGSMGTPIGDGKTKMSYAKTSALRVAQMLGEGDQVGVVTFGNRDKGAVVLPMTDAAQKDTVRAGIEKLAHANENTYLLAGLKCAYELLAPVDAAVKHVVVISDGEWSLAEEFVLGSLVNRMREGSKVTLSLLAITDKDTDASFLKAAGRLSKDGGGEFFAIEDARSVPMFVSAEVTRSLTRVGRQPRSGPGTGEQPPGASGTNSSSGK